MTKNEILGKLLEIESQLEKLEQKVEERVDEECSSLSGSLSFQYARIEGQLSAVEKQGPQSGGMNRAVPKDIVLEFGYQTT